MFWAFFVFLISSHIIPGNSCNDLELLKNKANKLVIPAKAGI